MPLIDGATYGHGWHTSKFEVLREIIEGTDQKIVVFSQFEKAVTLGVAMCDSLGIGCVRHTGKESNKERDEQLTKWRCDSSVQVCFLTIASGSVGLNLTEASICVFMDKAWTIASNDQAANRLHRPGQKSAVTIYELLVRGSIEEWKIEEKLQGKLRLTEEIIQMAERRIKEVER
jgi:SNF2 family DNA or RNA helicase